MDSLTESAKEELLERLMRGTRRDRYAWQAISAQNEYAFALVAGKFGFTLFSVDRDDRAPIGLDVVEFGSQGAPKTIQSMSTTVDAEALNDYLQELYDLVKRKVFRLDTIAEEIFASLDEIDSDDSGGGAAEPRS